MANTNNLKKTTEDEVADIVIKVIKKSDKEYLTPKEIYELVSSHMKENGLLKEDDLVSYKGRSTTRLQSTIHNLFSHENEKLYKTFGITKTSKGKNKVKTGVQTSMDLFSEEDVIVKEEEMLEDVLVNKVSDSDIVEIREAWLRYTMVKSNSSEGVLRLLMDLLSDEELIAWANQNGGVEVFAEKLRTGLTKKERGKGITELDNYDEMTDLLMEAILSNKPTLIIRDYDNDGVACQSSMDTLLRELESMGIEHKVHIKQTHGGEIRGINEQDMVYIEEMKKLYPGEDLEYLFTMDNGVSSNEEIENIKKEMNIKPKVGVIDHHSLDSTASLGTSLHLNPELNEGDPEKPSAGGIVASLALSIYLKYCENSKITPKETIIIQLQKIGAHANLVDMVKTVVDNLPDDAKKAAEMGALMNVYIKYESLFRDEKKLKTYLKSASPKRADALFRRFLSLSKMAKDIIQSVENNDSMDKLTAEYIFSGLETENLSMDKDSISDLRTLAVRYGYSVDEKDLSIHELTMSLFRELKKLDKEVGSELRKDKSAHILGDYMINGVFLRIYNPNSPAPTKAIDTEFPKPTTGYTISLTPTIKSDGTIEFARGGYRSTEKGGHTLFEHLNNEILEILFRGHKNAAGAFVNIKAKSIESFTKIMQTHMKKVSGVIQTRQEEKGFDKKIIEIDRETSFLLPAISSINETVNAELFPIEAGFDIAVKGEYINKLLKDNRKEGPYKSIPISFAGSVFIVPNNEYNDDDNIVFNGLPDGSWITAGSVVDNKYLIKNIGAYDKISEMASTKLEETYEKDEPLYSGYLSSADLKSTIGVAAGVGNEEEGVREAVGFVVDTMLKKNTYTSIVYDIETKGSSRGVNYEGERAVDSTKGNVASEVINGQFLIRKIKDGDIMKSKMFKRREFYIGQGRRVLLSEEEYIRVTEKHSADIEEREGLRYIKKDILRQGSFERVYSYEERGNDIVYNHQLESTTEDFLLKSDGEIPVSVVLLTHLNKIMTEKYGHPSNEINKGVDKLFKKLFAELPEGKNISLGAHNVAFDLDMTPNTIPVMKEIEKNPRLIVEDTTRIVKEILKEYTSFGQFKYGDFECYIQNFQNLQNKKDDLFTSAYVVEDFLAAKKVGHVINLAEGNSKFEYVKNGEALSLLYVKDDQPRVVVEDVTEMNPEELRGLVKYDVAKPTKYSMQLISNLATINGLLFLELTQDVEVPEFLGGLFDTFNDDVLTEVQKDFLKSYKFTYSSHQNMVSLMRKQIEVEGRTISVEGYIREKATAKFFANFPTFSDEEQKDFVSKTGLKMMEEQDTCMIDHIKVAGHNKIEEYVNEEKNKIKDSLYDFLIVNKDLGKLYELKILTYSLLHYIENLEFPFEKEKELKDYIDIIANHSGVEKATVEKVMTVINDNAKKIGHSPFHVEPHMNIGNLSDTIMESYLLSLFISLNERDMNRRDYLVGFQTLATAKSRNGSNIRQDVEEEYSKRIGKDLRESILKENLKPTNQKSYIIPNKPLTAKDYDEIVEDAEAVAWFEGIKISLENKVSSLQKEAGTVSMKEDGTVSYDKDEKKSVLEKVEKGEELSAYGKALHEIYQIDEVFKRIKKEGVLLKRKVENDERYSVEVTQKTAILRKINDNTFDFLNYVLKSKYYAEDDRKERNKWTKRMNETMDMEYPESFELKEEMMAMEETFLVAIMTDPKVAEDGELIKAFLRNFLLSEIHKNSGAIKEMNTRKIKSFKKPLSIILEGIPNGITNFMKCAETEEQDNPKHP